MAGELSGHIFFGAPWYGVDDALYAGVKILADLANQKNQYADAEAFFAQFPQGVATPEIQVAVPEQEKFALVEALAAHAHTLDATVNLTDGVRLEWDYG